DILASLGRWLSYTVPGIDVVTAPSGDEALKVLGDRRVDLILSDYVMPGLDGILLLRQARQRAPNVPRVLMTAFADEKVAIRAINEGNVERFLRKPLELNVLSSMVNDLLLERRRESDGHLRLAGALRRGGT
ncbi:MAG TPA: response regulator, partial [Candidatus Thermoplasmatota archaeon]|nr:response regulator [Candidatus Thermoplasmatota archaeon]